MIGTMAQVKRYPGCSVSPQFHEWAEEQSCQADYVRWSMEVRAIFPNCHPQSKIGRLASTSMYHIVFLRGTDVDRDCPCSVSSHDGMFDYNGLWQGSLCLLTNQFPDKAEDIMKTYYSIGSLLCCLVSRNQKGKVHLLSMAIARLDESKSMHFMTYWLTLSGPPDPHSNYTLPNLGRGKSGPCGKEFRGRGMIIAVTYSLQFWSAHRQVTDMRPAKEKWSLLASCPTELVPYMADHGFIWAGKYHQGSCLPMYLEGPLRISFFEAGPQVTPENTKRDRCCCKTKGLKILGPKSYSPCDDQETGLYHLIQKSSLFHSRWLDLASCLKSKFKIRCDNCGVVSPPFWRKSFGITFIHWMTDHLLACLKTDNNLKMLVTATDLTLKTGILNSDLIARFYECLDCILNSTIECSCVGGCGDLSFKELSVRRGEESKYLFYQTLSVEILESKGALARVDVMPSNTRRITRTRKPLSGAGPHWIIQLEDYKCCHFDDDVVSVHFKKSFLKWGRDHPRQFQNVTCGKKRCHDTSGRIVGVPRLLNYQQGDRPLCVPLSLASGLLHYNDIKANKLILASTHEFLKSRRPVSVALDLLRRKLKYSVTVERNVAFSDLKPDCFHPTLLIMKGSNGYVGHCVTMIRGVIFDASDGAAKPFSRSRLDQSCSSKTCKVRFSNAFRVYHCIREKQK